MRGLASVTGALVVAFVLAMAAASLAAGHSPQPMPRVGEAELPPSAAADLGHGENDKFLGYIIGNTSSIVGWAIINGSFTPEALANVSILILGQPEVNLTSDEIDALQAWLASGPRVIWIGGDSDYRSGASRQAVANAILEAIGSHLRLELAEVMDGEHNTGRPWSLVGYAAPDNITEFNTSIISVNVTKPILLHGPTAVYWLSENGSCIDPVNTTIEGLVRILWSYNTSYIEDSQPPAPVCYADGQQGPFVLMAAEAIGDDLVIVSGETPYGGYQPMWTWYYYGTELDGPQFVSNVIAWAAWWVESHTQATTTTGTGTTTGGNTTGTGTTTAPSTETTTPISTTTGGAGTGTGTNTSTQPPETTTGTGGGAGTTSQPGTTTTPPSGGSSTGTQSVPPTTGAGTGTGTSTTGRPGEASGTQQPKTTTTPAGTTTPQESATGTTSTSSTGTGGGAAQSGTSTTTTSKGGLPPGVKAAVALTVAIAVVVAVYLILRP